MYRNRLLAVFVGFIFVTASMFGASVKPGYGRVWWELTANGERIQFIAGYLDCAVYDLGHTELSEAQWNVIGPEITNFYASHPMTTQMVPYLILTLGRTSRSTDTTPEVHSQKHGIFDGDYWRQIAPAGRTGFVEGYTACIASKSNGQAFTRHSVAWYVNRITKTYNLTPEDDIDDRQASKKIAIIVQELSR